MSRTPHPSTPSTPWEPEVLEAVRATPAPFYAVACPTPEGGWRVSLLEGDECAVRDSFAASDLRAADLELQRNGYLSLASAMRLDWEKISPKKSKKARGTPVFRDPEEQFRSLPD
ncbi:hypothetical protein LUR56_40755 [Streptomyces sp. MT29]|nr:hypothetical protein [Streptomyces sp. MT29]